jgi:hypothetical protein
MRNAAITYRDGRLAACEQGDVWIVRLAHLEARARYLDLALAELLGNAPEAHRAAARLLAELADLDQQESAHQSPAPVAPLRGGRRTPQRGLSAKLLVLGLRAVVFAVVAGTAFMLTTWLNTLR